MVYGDLRKLNISKGSERNGKCYNCKNFLFQLPDENIREYSGSITHKLRMETSLTFLIKMYIFTTPEISVGSGLSVYCNFYAVMVCTVLQVSLKRCVFLRDVTSVSFIAFPRTEFKVQKSPMDCFLFNNNVFFDPFLFSTVQTI